MPKYGRETALLVYKDYAQDEILPTETITNFRGEETKFCYISQLPEGNSEGKIIVSDTPEDSTSGRERYPSVYGAKIVLA